MNAKDRERAVDEHVGNRLRAARLYRGLTQTQLGDKCGVSFQQIQKYERGANRIGGSRLVQLSLLLGEPVSYFFDEMPDGLMEQVLPDAPVKMKSGKAYERAKLSTRRVMQAMENMTPEAQETAIKFIIALGKAGEKK